MRRIAIPINCTEKHCHCCNNWGEAGYLCRVFDKRLEKSKTDKSITGWDWLRCPECLAAEVKEDAK